jgi:hypothetical protein
MFKEMEFGTYYEAIACELRDALGRYYDSWLEILCREEGERPSYASTIEQKRITVVVLTCALIEHTINFYLGLKCNTADFAELERSSIMKKWTVIPKNLMPAYDLPISSALYRQLEAVVQRRNAIMHAKSKLSIDGDNRHAGNEPPGVLDENAFIEQSVSLPSQLLDHLLSFDQDAFPPMSSLGTSCGVVMRKVQAARCRLEYLARLPEGLVDEIMAQGHRRDRAKLFAVLIGEVPKQRLDRSIAVRRYGEVIAVLKPLKFFESTGFVLDLRDPALPRQRADQVQNGPDELQRDGEQAGER